MKLKICPICERSSSLVPFLIKKLKLVTCQNCTVILRAPFLSEVEQLKLLSEHYENIDPLLLVEQARKPLYAKILKWLERLQLGQKGKMLDVGCGGGLFLKMALDKGWEGCGVELSAQLRERALQHYGLTKVVEKTSYLKEEEKRMDVITFLDMLDETTFSRYFIKEAYRLLKPGGVLLIRVRNGLFQARLANFYYSLSFLLKKWMQKEPFVLNPINFTSKSLKYLLKQEGFSRVSVKNSSLTAGDPYSVFFLSFFSQIIKWIVFAFAKTVEWVTFRQCIVGPSLLLIGRKP